MECELCLRKVDWVLGVISQGRRLDRGFSLRGGDWNVGYPSGEKPTFGVVPQERIWQQIALCVF